MNDEKFLRCAVAHLENKLSATKIELAELKASLPQIKHDAIIEARDATREDGFFDEGESCRVLDLTQYAQSILTQAKGTDYERA